MIIENTLLSKQLNKNEIKWIIIKISISYLLLFTSFSSAQNIISQIYQQENQPQLAEIGLFSIYGVCTIANIFGNYIAQFVSYRNLIVYSKLGYTAFIASGNNKIIRNFSIILLKLRYIFLQLISVWFCSIYNR